MPTDTLQRGLRFGRHELQPATRQLLTGGEPVKIRARAFDVLMALVERRDRIVGKDELLELVWPGLVVEENNLQVHVSALRKALGPALISTIPGRGYRFTAVVDTGLGIDDREAGDAGEVDDAGAGGRQRPGTTPSRHNLPHERTHFIGRESTLADCTRLLADTRLLTLTGIGGCGKTRLALQLARQQLAAFTDGVWFVDLSSLSDPHRVAVALAAVVGLRETPGTPLADRLVQHLAGDRALLVLDNCEHVLDAVGALADALLAACPALKIVATSREGLSVPGEQVVAVPPLSLPIGADDAALHASEAVRLFIDRARLGLPAFALGERDAQAIGEICCRLDGIALAIELAAARVRMLSVTEIGARLGDRFRFLIGGNRALPRHQTLEATLHWSYGTLSAPEQQLFRCLAVFSGDWTLAAAAQVAGAADEHPVLEWLTQLHDKSLLVVNRDGATAPRYRLLETVRQYARERLAQAGETELARERHLQHYAALAERVLREIHGPGQAEWLARLGREQENLLAAHAWVEQAREDPGGAGLRLVAGLWRYWVASGQLERGYRLARAALGRPLALAPGLASGLAPGLAPALAAWRCRALWAAGRMAFLMGHYDETSRLGNECEALAAAIGDAELRAASLVLRAGGLYAVGALAAALPLFERARELAGGGEVNFVRVAALHGLAEVHRGLGETALAGAGYVEAIRVARELQDPRAIAVPLCNLARLSITAGDLPRARAVLRESLELATAAGLDGLGEQVLDVAAALAAMRGSATRAARFAGAAQASMRKAGRRRQPVDEAFVAGPLEMARAAVGEAAFDAARASGQALCYDEALAEVRAWLERGDEERA